MKKKIISALLALVMIFSTITVLASCGEETPDPGPGTECTEHVDTNKDYKCDVCGKSTVKKHSKHTDKDGDGVCDVEGCDKEVSSSGGSGGGSTGGTATSYDDIYWEDETLIFQMTNNDANGSLPSTCARYLAGEWTGTTDNIDDAVAKRNKNALKEANIKSVSYSYYPNTSNYGWGKVASVIMKEVASTDTSGLPDMYCDMVYDLVSASLQGCFANLYGTVRGQGQNYFPFNDFKEEYYKGKFNEEKDGQGYMYEYMTTLTLSKNKMYLIASDYFTDLVRGFYVVPVNVKLLEEVGLGITGDRVGDGDGFTLDDFYDEVKDYKWTYSKVAAYSQAIYKDEQNQGVKDFGDRLGWVISATGGLVSSGIIYTTACTIINRDLNTQIDDFEYSYPETNEKLFDLAAAIGDLVKKDGILVEVEKNMTNYGATYVEAIANRFAADKILFGGLVLLGGLENAQYQGMKDSKGFGVVPVPLYSDNIDDKYLTQIHNVGRIGAISVKTQKFEQCSAFLNYQSTHSTDIINDYYNYKLQYDIVGGASSTTEMLQYIRNNVRSAFDKTFEDAMGSFYDTDLERWNSILHMNRFEVDMRKSYDELLDKKQADLARLVLFYEKLPD